MLEEAERGGLGRPVTDTKTAYRRSLALLRDGRFEEGFRLHQSRLSLFMNLSLPKEKFWQGQDIAGKSIGVFGEQGFGDVIQFLRYVPMLAARGARVVLGSMHPELQSVLARVKGVAQLRVARQNPEGTGTVNFRDTDFWCPLMSLPLGFGTSSDAVPAGPAYVTPDHARVALWRSMLRIDNRRRVGLVWAGRPTNEIDARRSIPLPVLAEINRDRGVALISLQKDLRRGDDDHLAGNGDVGRYGERFRDFDDAAAIIAHLDLVITVDTAVAHLAGAMGKRVWVLLPTDADWRWMEGRDDSPWYPSARLFRQPRPGDWPAVIAAVRKELASLDALH